MVADKECDKPRSIRAAEILSDLMNPVRRLIEAFPRLVYGFGLPFYMYTHCPLKHVDNQRTRMAMG